ncbi:acyl-CoA thioesterase [Polyangium jinanense]|uniref:Acyl-CoA thioesterase n=1 Tax=Polyangium jinanense TaxID=2829994 RepID=A0A9X3XDJ4_9BACT|nr:acyl-CoA thioesterase [Polyangium jinanense]MDC3960810.1 acyl-CoA thioesterase [Polyangium jinanense]MDC3961025.1 acyl-CoA thioesterase [Polyangium jinanense]MDC3987445.1 acyl-CoA thioesterase [Polyangium jinanense]
MIAFVRPIKFEEVDAAGIVFFGHYLGFAHEAMEHFFGGLDGGYPHLIVKRRVGLPAVKVNMSFSAPARYGEVLRIETSTAHLGNRSATLRYRMLRDEGSVLVAMVEHTIVTTNLDVMASCPMPDDVRSILATHLSVEATSP